MKIVLPVHHFPPHSMAGAELYTFRLARWLQAHGYDVEVVCVEAIDWGRPGDLRVAADAYEGIPVRRLSFNLLEARDRLRWSYDNPLIGAWFAEYLKRTRPDLVHFQAGYLLGVAPVLAAHDAGIPSVLTLHDYWFLCPRITLQRGDGSLCETIPESPAGCAWCMRLASRRYRYPDRTSFGMVGWVAQIVGLAGEGATLAGRRARLLAALRLPDAVIAPSHFLARRFAPLVPAERLHVSRLGLDLSPFRGLARETHAALRFGFTGQIAPHKGVHLLVEAFRALRPGTAPLELHIYGGLEARQDYVVRLRRLAGSDARIQFHGRFENRRAGEILAGLDVAVVPSAWYENSPLAILEAHAAGTPVVTAALGGMAELVCDGRDGLHFRPFDAADLARQMQRLIDEPQLLPQLRQAVVAPRTIDDEMQQLVDIYRASVQPAAVLHQEP